MLCKNCGHDNPIQRLFCDNCGAELEHDLADVQAAVDSEIKRDKAKATAHSVRWLLGVSFVLFVIGIFFRNAYKDLPANDIVPFIAAPRVELSIPPTATTRRFGLPMPNPRVAPPPRPTLGPGAFKAKVVGEAYRQRLVSVQAKNVKEPLVGLLVSNLTLLCTPVGQAAPIGIQPADIALLRPADGGFWEIAARSLPDPVKATIADVQTIDLELLRQGPDGKPITDTIPLRHVVEIAPAETP